jgi:hypothetical protein
MDFHSGLRTSLEPQLLRAYRRSNLNVRFLDLVWISISPRHEPPHIGISERIPAARMG